MPDPQNVQMAATALMKYGGYEEQPDSLEWLRRESVDVALAVEEGRSVVDVLIDTAYCDPSDPESLATAHAVEQEIAAHANAPRGRANSVYFGSDAREAAS